MTRILILDPFHGASGDMLLGALVACGVSLDAVRSQLRTLPIGGWDLQQDAVKRGAIAAVKVRVRLEALGGHEESHGTAVHHGDPGDHDHHHGHASHDEKHHHHGGSNHHHHAPSGHEHLGPPEHRHGRTPGEMTAIIAASGLSLAAKALATRAISILAVAEATVHGTTPDEVHFHEVGAVDALVDICGVAVAIDLLDVKAVYGRRITTGYGIVRCAHGTMPVPAPATTLLLAGLPCRDGDLEAELVTPTGAALLRAMVTSWDEAPGHRTLSMGFGAGNSDWPGRSNVLRAVVAERDTHPAAPHEVVQITCDLDDMRAEGISFLLDRLMEAGALDVNFASITMKKGRPGTRLTALIRPVEIGPVGDCLFRHSTTFGFRYQVVARRVLDRAFVTVQTPYGPCRVKIGSENGRVLRARPEFEDVAALAKASGQSLEAIEILVLSDPQIPRVL